MTFKTSEILNLWNSLRRGKITQEEFEKQMKAKIGGIQK
jgi:hypothetical protein